MSHTKKKECGEGVTVVFVFNYALIVLPAHSQA